MISPDVWLKGMFWYTDNPGVFVSKSIVAEAAWADDARQHHTATAMSIRLCHGASRNFCMGATRNGLGR